MRIFRRAIIVSTTLLIFLIILPTGVKDVNHILPVRSALPIQQTSPESAVEFNKVRTSPIKNQSGRSTQNPFAEAMQRAARKHETYDQPGEAAEFYRLKRLPEGETELPVERYFTAREYMRLMPRYSTALNRELPPLATLKTGPEKSALGEWTQLGPGNIGGRTRAMLINPQNPNVMYAAGVAGGIWKTVNGGNSWTPMSDLLPNIAVNSMAMDPKNPNIIYAGTGEGYFNIDGVRGAGIFKTTDGGANWTRLEGTTSLDFYYVNDLVVSPLNSQRVYAATRSGVMQSSDGGVTWTRALNPSVNGGCLDLAVRTDQQTDYLFAACGLFQQATVYRNTDAAGAGSWTPVLTDSGMGRTSLAIAPSNQNVVYALSASIANNPYRDGLHAVFRSNLSGEAGSWMPQTRNTDAVKLNTALLSNPLLAFLAECGLGPGRLSSQGWYDNVIAVDPTDANRVWAGGIDLFRSDNGGINWGLASYWWPEKTNPHFLHADQHTIVFHPNYNGTSNRTMFVANDGGIFRTDNALSNVASGSNAACNPNSTGIVWTSLNNNYGVTQFYHGAVFPDGKTYFGGTQDNGTLIGNDTDGTNGWREILGGDGGYVAVNPNDPLQLYAETTRLSLRKSTDGGRTFGRAIFGIGEPENNFNFITPFTFDPSDPQRLWIGGKSIWRSFNGAASWVQANQPFQNGSIITALAVSPTNANILAVGTQAGYVYIHGSALFSDATFSIITNQPGRFGYVSSVTFDPKDYRTIYVTYSTFGGKHVWRVTDFGNTWTSIDGNGVNALPDIPVHCLALDPIDTDKIYIGTDIGVFVTRDGGVNWAVEDSGLANAPVEWMTINTANSLTTLYAFTHGRGVWSTKIAENACAYSLSSTNKAFSALGGNESVQVTKSSAGCALMATSNDQWITVTSINGDSVNFNISSNNDFRPRTGTINIAGRSFVIFQSGLVDRFPPTVNINLPTKNSVYVTSSNKIRLSGRANDDVAVFGGLLVVSDRGVNTNSNESYTPYYEQLNWITDELQLQLGVNKFTVTAKDISGKAGSSSITIIYKPEYIIATVAGVGPLVVENLGDGGPALKGQLLGPSGLTFDSMGNLFIADSDNNRVRIVSLDGIINTYAGGGRLTADGTPRLNALFFNPVDVIFDQAGNLCIAQQLIGRVYRVDKNGIVTRIAGGERFVGNSGDGGPANLARLRSPSGLAIDSSGNIFISDEGNANIRKVTIATGIITTICGTGEAGYSGDGGPATSAQLSGPVDIAFDSSGNLYVADRGNNRIRKITPDGKINSLVFTTDVGMTDSIEATSLTIDQSDNLLITTGSFGGTIHRINLQNNTITAIAGKPGVGGSSGTGDGTPALEITLLNPVGVTVDSQGVIYFSEASKHLVRKLMPFPTGDMSPPTLSIKFPTSSGTFSTIAPIINLEGDANDNTLLTHVSWESDRGGNGVATGLNQWKANGILLQPGMNQITVTAWDANGNSTIARINISYAPSAIIKSFIGNGRPGFNGDGIISDQTQLWLPQSVDFDSSGNLYIADTGNHRIRKVTRDGVITPLAGNGQLGSRGDGGQAVNAEFNSPSGLAVDASGAVYVSDTNNHRVRRIAPNGIITSIAGKGVDGFSGDGGPATEAMLDTPVGLALDNAGNLFIADTGNNRIRKLNLSTGIITTVAGNGYGNGGDGGAALAAGLYSPTSVAIDSAGNLYISDTGNHRVRKVTTSGIIDTIAGTGMPGFDGDGGAAKNAKVYSPGGLELDIQGNLYIADQGNHRIRLIRPDGTISTFAGNGLTGLDDEVGQATAVRLTGPAGVAVDQAGNLFIADTGNHRVVAVTSFRNVASVSAASYLGPITASESIVAAFGSELATGIEVANSLPLPTSLAGTTVRVRDSAGNERLSPLFFVSPSQINYLVPPGTAPGAATVTIISGKGVISTGGLSVTSVAPGIFAANSNGQGAPAAVALRLRQDGSQIFESVAVFDQQRNQFVTKPIDLGTEADQVFLILFGTGLRGRQTLSTVTASIGGVNTEILYVGAQNDFVGLDQINLRLPRALAGRGEVDLVITVDGKTANTVRIAVR